MSDQLSKVVAGVRVTDEGVCLCGCTENCAVVAELRGEIRRCKAAFKQMNAIESAAAPVEVGGDVSRAEYVAGAVAAAWCKHDLSVREHRCKEAATLIRALASQLAEAESALAAATRRVAEVEDDAARWRFCTSEHELGDGQVAKMHINVGVNVWRGEKWLGFHECSPDEARAAIDDVLQKEPK